MNDKITDNNKRATPQSNEHLLADFFAQHTESGGRSNQDIQDNRDAQKTDSKTINAISSSSPDKNAINGLLKTDIQQDKQAAGNGKTNGTDQVNATQDDKIVSIDQQMLIANPNMTDAQRKALGVDIRTHRLDAQFSRQDVPTEKTYIQDDKALATALQSGIGVEQAKAAVVADRKQDIANENKYISNDQSMNAANRTVLELFGMPKIH